MPDSVARLNVNIQRTLPYTQQPYQNYITVSTILYTTATCSTACEASTILRSRRLVGARSLGKQVFGWKLEFTRAPFGPIQPSQRTLGLWDGVGWAVVGLQKKQVDSCSFQWIMTVVGAFSTQ